MKRLLAALLCAATPAIAQVSALPPEVQQVLRDTGTAMGPEPFNRTAAAFAPLMPPAAPTLRDAQYGPDPRNRLDVFSPGPGARPVLVFVHGGGFVGGDKARAGVHFYQNIGGWAARNDMVGVTITYRLAPAHPFPAVIEDITAALAWVRANIAAHGGDPARIILFGQSAGAAHVADYLAANAAAPGVAAGVLVSGVYDAASYPAGPTARSYYGNDEALLRARSALPGLTRLTIPMVTANAEFDPAPFHAQGALLPERMRARHMLLRGHNHVSPVFGFGSADTELSNAILTLR